MTDLHCHILPGVDDGSEDMEDSLVMARLATDSGVTTVIATPHCNLPGADRTNYAGAELNGRFAGLQKEIQRNGIPLTILPGAEVFVTADLPELLDEGRLPTLAGSRYLLCEFYFDESPDFMDDMFSEVLARGLVPVAAHPERYEAVQRDLSLAASWFHRGVVIQLNKGSLLGRLGSRAERAGLRLLSRGLAHCVASDAHGSLERTTHMTECREFITDQTDASYADILLNLNPERITKNLPLLPVDG